MQTLVRGVALCMTQLLQQGHSWKSFSKHSEPTQTIVIIATMLVIVTALQHFSITTGNWGSSLVVGYVIFCFLLVIIFRCLSCHEGCHIEGMECGRVSVWLLGCWHDRLGCSFKIEQASKMLFDSLNIYILLDQLSILQCTTSRLLRVSLQLKDQSFSTSAFDG